MMIMISQMMILNINRRKPVNRRHMICNTSSHCNGDNKLATNSTRLRRTGMLRETMRMVKMCPWP